MTMRPVYYTFTPATEDTDALANNVTAASGAAFTLAASAPSDGLAHKVVITPSGSVTGNYTISGKDADGQTVSETLATDTTNAVTSVKFYKSDIVVKAPAGLGAETVDIGWADEFATQTIPLEIYANAPSSVGVAVTGTLSYTVEGTLSDIRQSPQAEQADYDWQSNGNFDSIFHRALRVVVDSYSAGAAFTLSIITPL